MKTKSQEDKLKNTLNAVRIISSTLVGVLKDKYPIKHGNCFSVLADDGKEYKVVNFNYENLKEVCRLGISFPISMRALSERVAVLHDGRIPDEWYAEQFCETCCSESLLPITQKLRHERHEMIGFRIVHELFVTYDHSKIPKLEEPDTKKGT